MKREQRILLSMAVLAVTATGCGGGSADVTDRETTTGAKEPVSESPAEGEATPYPVSDELIQAAEAEGELTIYQRYWGDPNMWQEIASGIEEMWGAEVAFKAQEGPAISQVVATLQEEFKAGHPRSSDVIKASSLHTVPLGDQDMLEQIAWQEECPWITDESISDEFGSLIMGGEFSAHAINTDLIPPEDAPESYEDLTDPKYEGLIATTPYAGNWPQIGLSMGGVDKLEALLEELTENGNIAGFIPLSEAERVASGEFGMLINSGEADILALKESGAPIDVVYLGRRVLNTYMFEIIKGTSAVNTAKLAGCYLMTPEGQEVLYEYQLYASPSIEGTVTYEKYQSAVEAGEEPLMDTPDLYREHPEAYVDFAGRYAEIVGLR